MAWRRSGPVWLLFGVIAVVSSVLVMRRPAWDRLSDLHIYYGAAQTVEASRPLYEYAAANGGPFTYPPFAMLLLRPIAALPEPAVQVIWLILICAAVVAIAAALAGAITTAPRHRQLVIAVIACAVLVSGPAQSNLRFGQVSMFIVLLALVDAVGLTPARYRGVLIGVAAAIKLTPLLFVVFFLVSRRHRDAGRAVATFVGCAVLAAVALPADSWTYWTGTMLETSRIGNLASLGNQSVHGMLMRVGVSPDTLPMLWAGLVAVICGTALLRARRIQLDDQPVRAAVLVGCATVVASPVSWTHHQVWTVLAAMLLVATRGLPRRIAGVVLLLVMTLSLGALLSDVSTFPGLQFLLENARTLGVVATCLAGLGGVAAVAVSTARRAGHRRGWLRAVTATTATLVCFAVLPLPAGADPTFKAYTLADAGNPRYFYFCRDRVGCAAPATGVAVRFAVLREKTKVRVNGVVDGSVARLEYRSAPGGAPRVIPLLDLHPEQREFSFRSANMAHGLLVAYGVDGHELASFTDELNPSSDAGGYFAGQVFERFAVLLWVVEADQADRDPQAGLVDEHRAVLGVRLVADAGQRPDLVLELTLDVEDLLRPVADVHLHLGGRPGHRSGVGARLPDRHRVVERGAGQPLGLLLGHQRAGVHRQGRRRLLGHRRVRGGGGHGRRVSGSLAARRRGPGGTHGRTSVARRTATRQPEEARASPPPPASCANGYGCV